ncbi:protein javelin [Anoplophora glabripennis]|uniref:protein javelin n=1 Tax=Anoplophora glabripennis TaxID=217634 RepID=UPI00087522EA|nr:protein javelin [Anoplophora glabripennis]
MSRAPARHRSDAPGFPEEDPDRLAPRTRAATIGTAHSNLQNDAAEFIHEAQEALWMVDDGPAKGQGQRKRRHERESCINNVKLTLNCTKDYSSYSSRHVDNSTYTKRPKEKFKRGSLENVSSDPWGEFDGQSSLRRTRSWAVSGENIFSGSDFPGSGTRNKQRRSQLIPRAKLINRTSVRENRYKGKSADNLESAGRSRRPQPSISPPDYSPPQPNFIEQHRQNRNLEHDIYAYASLQNIPETTKHDSLDSNYNNKTSANSIYRVSYEDLPELSLPNYYPDSKYDTDNTDNFSVVEVDNVSSISLDNLSKTKFPSFDNLKFKWESVDQHESISYDENIVLTANKSLYDSTESKPKTIRRPTPYHESHSFGTINPNSLPSHSEHSDEERADGEDTSGEYIETDTNLDEINLNNEDIAKVIEVNIESDENSVCNSNIETSTLCEGSETVKESEQEPEHKTTSSIGEQEESRTSDTPIKTLIEVSAGEESTREKTENSEQYKTVVSVDTRPSKQDRTEEEAKCKHTRKETKHHSHNYLREFLETQKGSRKPLQNFIAKKFSNLSRRNSKDTSNLTENQFYSLPDITASKNLRKCEKIDRKLRKCEKSNQFLTSRETAIENRFIVNIGRHFDITANSSIPVDFEVKIAKVPKKNKKQSGGKSKSDEQLIAAVKSLKETLHGSQINLDENHNVSKPEIVSITTKPTEGNTEMANCKDECKELKERLGTMRSYWDKMTGNQSKDEGEKDISTCKIIDLHTKVEDVKKIFEQAEEKHEDKPSSKVQLTKQLFEPKPAPEKVEKISPLIKETCSYFENNANTFFDNDRQFESLCPSAMEIIDKDAKPEKAQPQKDTKPTNKPAAKPRSKKTVCKTKSICAPPEFDHVRYKVVKSDLFQKKIFAKCEKESQFDGLMQYLQDYSFQELLIDNNIVIIEPIRSKVHYEPSNTKTIKNVTPLLHKREDEDEDNKSGLNRHFFYHPIRVNREVNDDELPNPDTVRQVRELFEGGLKSSKSIEDLDNAEDKYVPNNTDPDKDRCSATDSNSHPSNMSDFGSQENLYDSIDNEIYCEYVSEDILEKIREHGTTITYYGGRVVDRKSGQPVLTKAIMEEIRNNEKRCKDCNNCRKNGMEKSVESKNMEEYVGVKFRILKSNSCSSRLELVGTEDIQETRKKFITKHKRVSKKKMERSKETIEEVSSEKEKYTEKERTKDRKTCDKNAINESIKKQSREENQPKIIGEERKVQENKYVQWGETKKETSFANIQFSDKNSNKIFDYHNYDKIKTRTKRIDDMEFEPYEVA